MAEIVVYKRKLGWCPDRKINITWVRLTDIHEIKLIPQQIVLQFLNRQESRHQLIHSQNSR